MKKLKKILASCLSLALALSMIVGATIIAQAGNGTGNGGGDGKGNPQYNIQFVLNGSKWADRVNTKFAALTVEDGGVIGEKMPTYTKDGEPVVFTWYLHNNDKKVLAAYPGVFVDENGKKKTLTTEEIKSMKIICDNLKFKPAGIQANEKEPEEPVIVTYKVTFLNDKTVLETYDAQSGDSVVAPEAVPTKKDTDTYHQTPRYIYTFDGWTMTGDDEKTVYTTAEVQAMNVVDKDLEFVAHFKERIEPAHFFVRYDGIEQEENGSTHYSKDFYTKDIVTRELNEYKQINANSRKNEDGQYEADAATLQAIIDNIIPGDDGIPTINDFTFKDPEIQNNKDQYEVKWYVIKKESDFWHVDGAVVRKAAEKEEEEIEENPETVRVEFYNFDDTSIAGFTINKGTSLTEAIPTQTATPSNEGYTYTFIGWMMDGNRDAELMQADDILAMSFTKEVTSFTAVYRESAVLAEKIEADKKNDDESKVLGEVFTAEDEEETSVLGAEFGNTGDNTPIVIMAVLLVLSGLTALMAIRRKFNR